MLSFFDYELPPDRIAQRPVGLTGARSDAKLLHVTISPDGDDAAIEDRFVSELPEMLTAGDLIVLNDTRVLPARFFAKGPRGSVIELLLLERVREDGSGSEEWRALARPLRRVRSGDVLQLSDALEAEALGRTDDGASLRLVLRCTAAAPAGATISSAIERDGVMPIPGYIRDGRADEPDRMLYQTVFARNVGSVAAPTAGLHFTPELLDRLASAGIEHRFITLHVGPASFQPVRDMEAHRMPEERYVVSDDCWSAIARVKRSGGRVIAVGTTTTRALEGAVQSHGGDIPSATTAGSTSIFITPGTKLRIIDALMTNFHQPRTTHLLLVAAFAGEPAVSDAYAHALRSGYRFLSYGDAMLLDVARR